MSTCHNLCSPGSQQPRGPQNQERKQGQEIAAGVKMWNSEAEGIYEIIGAARQGQTSMVNYFQGEKVKERLVIL